MKNVSINILKALAAVLVICIHCPFQGRMGILISNLARIAVPIFLLISGFYCYGNSKEKISKKIKHILTLIIISNLIYVLYLIISGNIQYILGIFNPKNLIKIIFFNDNPFRTHLWYLNAVFYCYIIYYIFYKIIQEKNNKIRKVGLLSAILLLISYVLISMFYINMDRADKTFIIRNFIFVGFPFFVIGRMINKYQIFNMISNKKIYIIMIISTALMILESYFYLSELYIGNIFLAISIFTFCIKNPLIFKEKILEKIGEKYSIYIYYTHC